MTFREAARDAEPSITAVAPGGLTTAEEPETRVALEEEAEETPRPEPVEAGASPRGEDPVRLYLKEIGKVPLLTAAQEVQIGRRIEVGQIALRRTLAGIPDPRVGTPVTLWGEGLPVDEVAAPAGTVGYELLCALAPRVPVSEAS